MATLYSSFKTDTGIGCDILCEKGNLICIRGRDMNQKLFSNCMGRKNRKFIFKPEAMGYHLGS